MGLPPSDAPKDSKEIDLTSTLNIASLRSVPDFVDTDRVTIGRDSSSEIFLDDVTVSRKHCQILRTKSGTATTFEVEDLKSLNGTYVNAVSKVKTSLNQGDEVQVGKYRLTFFRPVIGQRTGEIH